MSVIVGIGTAVPPVEVTQALARDMAQKLFADVGLDVGRLLPVFEHAGVEKRYASAPPEWFAEDHGFPDRNTRYVATALTLSERAGRDACEAAGLGPDAVDHVFMVSTTGLSTPSLDAHLVNRMPLRRDVRRSPIWGLGCAGGVAGLSRAHDWLAGHPGGCALVIAVELCTLTFLKQDTSVGNFVATALFGDGCGAAVLVGDELWASMRSEGDANRGLRVVGTDAVTWPDTLDVMGWDLREEGLKVLFSKSIPGLVRASARDTIETFLARQGVTVDDLDAFLIHPGGAKVIDAYREALELEEDRLADTRAVLRNFGNMSSATVMFVLARYMTRRTFHKGNHILSGALGPGFSSELLLARSV